MEKIYFLEETYEEWLHNALEIDSGTEGTVMAFGDEVIKILHSNLDAFTKHRLRKLSDIKELEDFITMPTKEIYYDFRFIGFAMRYAGINLKDLFVSKINDGSLTLEDKIFYLRSIRDCIEELGKFNVIHGDIQPRNIMVNFNDDVLLGDINNCSFSHFRNPYFNEISKRLYQKYGLNHIVDLQTFNYFTYLIMNCDNEELKDILNVGADIIWYKDISEIDNKYFDDEVCKRQLDFILERNSKRKVLENSDYLINHLK